MHEHELCCCALLRRGKQTRRVVIGRGSPLDNGAHCITHGYASAGDTELQRRHARVADLAEEGGSPEDTKPEYDPNPTLSHFKKSRKCFFRISRTPKPDAFPSARTARKRRHNLPPGPSRQVPLTQ